MNETNLSLKYLIDQLHKEQTLTKEEWITLIEDTLRNFRISLFPGPRRTPPLLWTRCLRPRSDRIYQLL